MNSVHDMGGMHGLGAIVAESDEPVFHHDWEKRVLALTLAAGAWGRWNIDASRHQREKISGPTFLAMSYYEKWLTGLVELLNKTGLATRTEIETGRPADGSTRLVPPLTAARVATVLASGGPVAREISSPPRFAVGDTVRARTINPAGHTRLPRYVRGRQGMVERDHGGHVFPDANAHGQGECPQRLYGVRFSARELWGDAVGARDAVYLDLWESYLEPA